MSRSALFEFYDSIRLWIEKHRKPGLAVVALGEDVLQAKAHLSATEGVNTAIAGRHELAEIWLADDPAVVIRHLAVLVFSVSGRVRFRLIDLRTAAGFTDDAGHVLRACEAEEAFFIRCGRYSVLFVPTTMRRAGPKNPGSCGRRFEHAERRPSPRHNPPRSTTAGYRGTRMRSVSS